MYSSKHAFASVDNKFSCASHGSVELNGLRYWALSETTPDGGAIIYSLVYYPRSGELIAGLIALAKSVAQEMGSRGIRANAIAPGFIETAMTAALSEDVRKEWMKAIPLRRGGKPEDIADVATFLASDMSSYISGQVIQVDGGMNM